MRTFIILTQEKISSGLRVPKSTQRIMQINPEKFMEMCDLYDDCENEESSEHHSEDNSDDGFANNLSNIMDDY